MRFDYTGLVSLAPDTGEPTVIFRPEIRITVHGPHASGEFVGLVDTGADNTVLPESVAHSLGIPLIPGKGPAAQAFGGQQLSLSYGEVALELGGHGGPLRWRTQAYFVAGGNNDETIVLGHQGFLEYFTATFVGEDFSLDLTPNPYLLQIATA